MAYKIPKDSTPCPKCEGERFVMTEKRVSGYSRLIPFARPCRYCAGSGYINAVPVTLDGKMLAAGGAR